MKRLNAWSILVAVLFLFSHFFSFCSCCFARRNYVNDCLVLTKNFCDADVSKGSSDLQNPTLEETLVDTASELKKGLDGLFDEDMQKGKAFQEGFQVATLDRLLFMRDIDRFSKDIEAGKERGRSKSARLETFIKRLKKINKFVGYNVGDFLLLLSKQQAEDVSRLINEYKYQAEWRLKELTDPPSRPMRKSRKKLDESKSNKRGRQKLPIRKFYNMSNCFRPNKQVIQKEGLPFLKVKLPCSEMVVHANVN